MTHSVSLRLIRPRPEVPLQKTSDRLPAQAAVFLSFGGLLAVHAVKAKFFKQITAI